LLERRPTETFFKRLTNSIIKPMEGTLFKEAILDDGWKSRGDSSTVFNMCVGVKNLKKRRKELMINGQSIFLLILKVFMLKLLKLRIILFEIFS